MTIDLKLWSFVCYSARLLLNHIKWRRKHCSEYNSQHLKCKMIVKIHPKWLTLATGKICKVQDLF